MITVRLLSPTRLALCLVITIAAFGCDDNPLQQSKPPAPGPMAVVTTTDFSTGALSTVRLDMTHAVTKNVASIHSDAVVRVYEGLVYVVNRFGADNIQVLDPARGFALVKQFSVGNGADPHDIVVVAANKAYVTRYNETGVWVVDPTTGAHTGTIDFSPFADADGTPEIDQMALDGGRLFVTLGRLDRNNPLWPPAGPGAVAVVDADADTLLDADAVTPGVQPIVLAGGDPYSTLQLDPAAGNLYVACVGAWGASDAGVEWVDPATMTAAGTLLSGASAGGDITDVEIVTATRGYAIVTDASYATSLIAFDPSSGAVVDTVYAPGTFSLQDAEATATTGELYVTDRSTTAPGIRIYNAVTGAAITTTPLDVGLPPFNIAFWE